MINFNKRKGKIFLGDMNIYIENPENHLLELPGVSRLPNTRSNSKASSIPTRPPENIIENTYFQKYKILVRND